MSAASSDGAATAARDHWRANRLRVSSSAAAISIVTPITRTCRGGTSPGEVTPQV